MEIRSHRPEVIAALTEVIDLAVAHGADVHPGAWVEEHDGEIAVHAGPTARDGTPLVRIPRDVLVPASDARWEVHDDDIVLVAPDPSWTDVQHRLAHAMTDVYRVTRKIGRARTGLPWWSLHDRPDLVAAIRTLRPGFPTHRPDLAETFLQSRTLGRRDERVLMPIADWIDHHAHGTPFHVDDDGLTVRVGRTGTTTTFGATTACSVRYHRHADPLDMALGYGFVDVDATCVRCAPVNLEIDGVGPVVVMASGATEPFRVEPPHVGFDGETLQLGNVRFDVDRPQVLVDLLTMPVTAIRRRRTDVTHDDTGPDDRTIALRIVQAMAAAHRQLVCAARDTFRTASPGDAIVAAALGDAIVTASPGDAIVTATLDRHVALLDRHDDALTTQP